ncbi:hypothetical protein LR48_Vigan05g028700 [Vigna angularis]|uniref:Uncharacterized protein n=1 Tax=Phaseolus angularis TaxID=3914 RepID=A0A0L9UIT0_PHAAN|nr:hypothetical protein LR48_Vigan05g028700 [Vigna angularis]
MRLSSTQAAIQGDRRSWSPQAWDGLADLWWPCLADSEPNIIHGVVAETGHVIRTSIGGRNGQSKQGATYNISCNCWQNSDHHSRTDRCRSTPSITITVAVGKGVLSGRDAP